MLPMNSLDVFFTFARRKKKLLYSSNRITPRTWNKHCECNNVYSAEIPRPYAVDGRVRSRICSLTGIPFYKEKTTA